MELVIKSTNQFLSFEDAFSKEIKHVATKLEVERITMFYAQLITNNPKQRKASSLETYINSAKPFISFIQQNGLNFNTLIDFRKALENSVLSISTKNSYLIVAGEICEQAYNRQGISFKPATIKIFKESKEHKKVGFDQMEVETIFNYVDTIKKDHIKIKAGLMIMLFAFHGLRSKELTTLKVSDFDFKNNTIKVLRKGKDEKTTISIYHTDLEQVFNKWVQLKGLEENNFVFGNKAKTKAIATANVREFLIGNTRKGIRQNGITEKAGVFGFGLHCFRHFFITWLIL